MNFVAQEDDFKNWKIVIKKWSNKTESILIIYYLLDEKDELKLVV